MRCNDRYRRQPTNSHRFNQVNRIWFFLREIFFCCHEQIIGERKTNEKRENLS